MPRGILVSMEKTVKKEQSSDMFEERYAALNPEQKKAVDTVEGPVMVVAGPGTGKTEILTLRIANILRKTDTAPENILALTFTDAAAGNMRRRLAALIGARAYRVRIETFHSFCNTVIANFPEYFPTIIGSGNITEVESIAIIEEIITDLPLFVLKPWGEPLHYVKTIYRKIEELKREGLTPDEFCQIAIREEKKFEGREDLYHEKGAYKGKMKAEHKDFERRIRKSKELCDVYDAYQKIIRTRRLYDWSDMIMEVLSALSTDKDLKLQLQETHQYILVDEHQDTNRAQNKILELLGDFHAQPNMFIVGDEKQAIFRFQGASIENFLHFKKLYPGAILIELKSNYRSRQHILDAAHSLIESPLALVAGRQFGDSGESGIFTAELDTHSHELQFVAKRIKGLIGSGVPAEEICVIYRANREAFPMALALDRAGVAYSIESDEDLLSEKFVRKMLSILDAVFHYSKDEYVVPVLHIEEFGIDPLEAYRLISRASRERVPLYDLLARATEPKIGKLGELLSQWVKASHEEHLSQFLEKVLRESGILNSMIASRNAEAFLGIERLFEEGKRISENRPGAQFADFMEYIRVLREREIFIKRPKHHARVGSVRLMTAHRSKGLEFEHVHIIGATEKSFGGKGRGDDLPLLPAVFKIIAEAQDESTDESGDERRLFYVALTRAKHSVCISYPRTDANGREILPTPFVLQIREDLKQEIDTTEFEQELVAHPERAFAEPQGKGRIRQMDQEFVAELFTSRPMSVTALNNYLSCPWKYFYRNLLRIPSVPERHQLYGTAMHAAVEDMWRVMKDRDITADFLTDAYKRHLGLLGILTKQEFAEALNRGEQALHGWFAWATPKLTNPVISEFVIPCVTLSGEEDAVGSSMKVDLSGKLDKVEMIGSSQVVVTDYKTGKQRSRNYIEGKTQAATGDIKRQLVFYKILLRLHDNLDMRTGIIEFLEPSDSGGYSREAFEITDEETAELTRTILRVAHEITSLAFWNTTCDDKECEYCGYRKLLQ